LLFGSISLHTAAAPGFISFGLASLGGLHIWHFHEERYSLAATSQATRLFCLMSSTIGYISSLSMACHS
jgi:hypothetical protein